ncbi:MAG: hypothetical protein ABW003_06310 [Microvirga sp.]
MGHMKLKWAEESNWIDICHDQIEEKLIRAYVQLVFAPTHADGLRTVTLGKFGSVEARLTEIPEKDRHPRVPPFWVEIYSPASGWVENSCGCFEFDEDELATAVELIVEARQSEMALS